MLEMLGVLLSLSADPPRDPQFTAPDVTMALMCKSPSSRAEADLKESGFVKFIEGIGVIGGSASFDDGRMLMSFWVDEQKTIMVTLRSSDEDKTCVFAVARDTEAVTP